MSARIPSLPHHRRKSGGGAAALKVGAVFARLTRPSPGLRRPAPATDSVPKAGRARRLAWMCAAALLVLTGCWDRLEIEQRAIVLGIAVDEATPGELRQSSTSSRLSPAPRGPGVVPLRLTAQIAVPGRIPLGPGDAGGGGGGSSGGGSGGGGDGGEGGQRPVWVLSAVGHSMEDAVSNLQQEVADPLFFGHLRILVMSEGVARKGVIDINDWLRRNADVRRTLWLTVSRGNAAAVMEAAPPLERVPVLYLWATLSRAEQMGKLPPSYGNVFWRAFSSSGQEPYLPYLEIRQKDNIFIRGLAYFKGNHMVGTLDPWDIGLFMGIKGFNPGGYSAFVEVPGTGEHVMVQALHRKAKIEVFWAKDRPGIRVRSHVEAVVREKVGGRVDLRSPPDVQMLEDVISRSLSRNMEQLIRKTQRDGADIFGFGQYVRARMFGYWRRAVHTKQDWERLYPTIPVQVEATVNLRQSGTLNR
ncbi:MAG: Ger(x)C family spore germination protein [Kyrpidia sp.]|nr:Ger(x)C family spore germination protein [Kyrpidia sp.]